MEYKLPDAERSECTADGEIYPKPELPFDCLVAAVAIYNGGGRCFDVDLICEGIQLMFPYYQGVDWSPAVMRDVDQNIRLCCSTARGDGKFIEAERTETTEYYQVVKGLLRRKFVPWLQKNRSRDWDNWTNPKGAFFDMLDQIFDTKLDLFKENVVQPKAPTTPGKEDTENGSRKRGHQEVKYKELDANLFYGRKYPYRLNIDWKSLSTEAEPDFEEVFPKLLKQGHFPISTSRQEYAFLARLYKKHAHLVICQEFEIPNWENGCGDKVNLVELSMLDCIEQLEKEAKNSSDPELKWSAGMWKKVTRHVAARVQAKKEMEEEERLEEENRIGGTRSPTPPVDERKRKSSSPSKTSNQPLVTRRSPRSKPDRKEVNIRPSPKS